MKKYFFYIFFFIFLFIAMEILSSLGLFMLRKFRHIQYQPIFFPILPAQKEIIRNILSDNKVFFTYSATLGWTVKPNSESTGWIVRPNRESKSALYRSNSQGIRADRDYPLNVPTSGQFRLAAFGDSFTFCVDVANHETWEAQLEAIDQHLEVLNFGVGGYALDQAFLRYKEDGIKFHPHIVLIGHMSENIYRLLTTFWPFYYPGGDIPFGKPRFILKNDQLVLVDNPLSKREDLEKLVKDDRGVLERLKAQDYYATHRYFQGPFDFLASVRIMKIATSRFLRGDDVFKRKIYDTSGEAYQLTTKLIDEFYLLAESNSSIPIVLLFPNQSDLRMYIKNHKTCYSPLVEYLEKKGYRYIDLLNVFKDKIDSKKKIEEMLPNHNSPEANQLIAQFIYSYLKTNHLLEKKPLPPTKPSANSKL